MLDYRDISLMESVPLLWRTVTASPVGIETMTILEGGGPKKCMIARYLSWFVIQVGLDQYPKSKTTGTLLPRTRWRTMLLHDTPQVLALPNNGWLQIKSGVTGKSTGNQVLTAKSRSFMEFVRNLPWNHSLETSRFAFALGVRQQREHGCKGRPTWPVQAHFKNCEAQFASRIF